MIACALLRFALFEPRRPYLRCPIRKSDTRQQPKGTSLPQTWRSHKGMCHSGHRVNLARNVQRR